MRKSTELQVVNADTGEVVRGQLTVFNGRKKMHEQFVFVFQRGLRYLSELRLNGSQSTILFYMLSNLNKENQIIHDYGACLVATGILRPNQVRIIQELHGLGVVIRDVKVGSAWIYTVHPYLAWRGSVEDYIARLSRAQPLDDWDEIVNHHA